MVQTREEKNKAASQSRFRKHQQRYESLMHGTISLFDRAAKDHLSHDAMLAHKAEWLKTDGCVGWVCERVYAVWDTLMHLHYRKLTFCYPHPDTGEMRPSNELIEAGLVHRMDTQAGAHCYRNEDGSFTDKFN